MPRAGLRARAFRAPIESGFWKLQAGRSAVILKAVRHAEIHRGTTFLEAAKASVHYAKRLQASQKACCTLARHFHCMQHIHYWGKFVDISPVNQYRPNLYCMQAKELP